MLMTMSVTDAGRLKWSVRRARGVSGRGRHVMHMSARSLSVYVDALRVTVKLP